MVSSNLPGVSQTLTLLVSSRYTDDYNEFGAYAAATLLMMIAIVVLLLMTLVERRTGTNQIDRRKASNEADAAVEPVEKAPKTQESELV